LTIWQEAGFRLPERSAMRERYKRDRVGARVSSGAARFRYRRRWGRNKTPTASCRAVNQIFGLDVCAPKKKPPPRPTPKASGGEVGGAWAVAGSRPISLTARHKAVGVGNRPIGCLGHGKSVGKPRLHRHGAAGGSCDVLRKHGEHETLGQEKLAFVRRRAQREAARDAR